MLVTMPDGSKFNLSTREDLYWFFSHFGNSEDPEVQALIKSMLSIPAINQIYLQWKDEQAAYNNAKESGDMSSYYRDMATSGMTPSATTEKAVDNAVSRENTEQAQNYETQMRDTSLTSAGQQLEALGLSASNVVSTGGVSTNGVGAAQTNMHSAASLAQQNAINRYNQRMSMARQVIAMAGNMASSGIYGSAIGAAKHSAAALAAATSHSALKALKSDNKLPGNYGDFYKEFPLPRQGGNNSPI